MVERRTIGRIFNATIEQYQVCKYHAKPEDFENSKMTKINGVESWDIITGEDAKKIEAESDGSCIDDMHAYLVLNLADGRTCTFRNSYCDMFNF